MGASVRSPASVRVAPPSRVSQGRPCADDAREPLPRSRSAAWAVPGQWPSPGSSATRAPYTRESTEKPISPSTFCSTPRCNGMVGRPSATASGRIIGWADAPCAPDNELAK